MNFRDYRLWVAVVVALVFVAAVLFLGDTQAPDTPIGTGTEAPPGASQYLDFQAKESRLRSLAEEDPDNPRIFATLGDLYFENNNFSEAIIQYEKTLELNPEDVDTYNDLGLAYHYSGMSALAEETLRKGIEVDPSYQRIWLSLGFVLTASGQDVKAEKALEKAISINPASDMGREARRIMDTMKGVSK